MLQKWFVANGPIGSGKTTLFRKLLAEAKKFDIPVSGYLEPLLMENGRRFGYDVQIIGSEMYKPMTFVTQREKVTSDGWIFNFDEKTIKDTQKIIESMKLNGKPTILLFDEFGRLESKGKGLWDSIYTLIKRYKEANIPIYPVVTCREQTYKPLRNSLKDAFNWPKEAECLMLPAEERNANAFIDTIIRYASE